MIERELYYHFFRVGSSQLMLEDYMETTDGDYVWLRGHKWEKVYGTTTIHQMMENPNYLAQQSGARGAGKTPDYMYAWMSNEDLSELLDEGIMPMGRNYKGYNRNSDELTTVQTYDKHNYFGSAIDCIANMFYQCSTTNQPTDYKADRSPRE